MYQKPFVEFRANLVETVSLATLVAIAILNVGVASYYPLGIEADGLQKQYVRFVHLIEAVLLGFTPFLLVVFVFLSLLSQLVRLARILIQGTRWLIFKSKTFSHRPQLGQVQPFLLPRVSVMTKLLYRPGKCFINATSKELRRGLRILTEKLRKSLSPNFSRSSFVIRVNLLHL